MRELSLNVKEQLLKKGLKLVTAESCTGGMVSTVLTDIPGSSAIFERGFVTYSNQSKHDLLRVSLQTLDQHGAVSEQTAGEMATGALDNSAADIAVSITGIAGPDGGTKDKPLGLVYIGFASKTGKNEVREYTFEGTRDNIRISSTKAALNLILEKIRTENE